MRRIRVIIPLRFVIPEISLYTWGKGAIWSSKDFTKTKQKVYGGGKRQTQRCRLLFCLLVPMLLLRYDPAAPSLENGNQYLHFNTISQAEATKIDIRLMF